MPPPAAIVVPTRERAAYLDVALATLAPQAAEHGAELLVVGDGPDHETREVAERHGASYVCHELPRGLNAARNTGLEHTEAPLVCFVDDDVAATPGWLAALLEADAREPGDVGVLTGPVLARFEGHALRICGREGPPITHLDLGPEDTDAPHAWGANLAVRRAWVERVGRFDASLPLYGDEQEWQARLRAGGGRIRYIAGAALHHRRAGDDARLSSLCRAARSRGRAARREDVAKGRIPSLRDELRVLAGCAVHGPRRRCMNGPVMTAHALGRVEEALRPAPAAGDDFLSGSSGTVGGLRGALRAFGDLLDDARTAPRRRRLRRAAAAGPRRRVLVLAVVRDDVPGLWEEAEAGLRASRHHVTVATTTPGGRGKFESLNALLAGHDLASFDWLLVCDDDVALPPGALDVLVHLAETHGLRLAQPAHRRRSHAAWPVTRRDASADARETTFVEIGPVTLFHRDTFEALLPFPGELRMGWGLDVHWSALARDRGWPVGVVDAVAIAHLLRPAGAAYPRDAAVAEARAFLAGRPYLRREEVRTLRSWRAA